MNRQKLEEGELCALCGQQAITTCPSCLDPLCAKCNRHHNPDDCLTDPFEPKENGEW